MKRLVVFLASVVLLTAGMQNWFAYNTVYWQDISLDSQMASLAGVTVPDVDSTNGTLLFASNQTEEVFYTVQMPHPYKFGTDLDLHIHWSKTTSAANDVSWKIDYECADVGEIFTGSLGTTLEFVSDVGHDDTANKHASYEVTLSNPGFSSLSGTCLVRLYRDHDDGDDTYAADARFYDFDVHYQADQPGSVSGDQKFQ